MSISQIRSTTVCRAPAYSIRTIKMSHGSVKKKKKVALLPQFPPHQSFSNLNMHQNQLESSLKCR